MADSEEPNGLEWSPRPAVRQSMNRRVLLQSAAVGSVVAAIGGILFVKSDDAANEKARAEVLPDGRHRLPPGQHLLKELRKMGGVPGDPSPEAFRLKVHGLVKHPLELTYKDLLAEPQIEQTCDVHCVTTWSMLDSHWTGVRVAHLAEKAGVLPEAHHVIFEAAHGYTTNVPLAEALRPEVLVAHHLQGDPLEGAHGSPVRGLVPSLYFWKSAKWLTGIRFVAQDEPGYWETRGYHNHADPWKEERYG